MQLRSMCLWVSVPLFGGLTQNPGGGFAGGHVLAVRARALNRAFTHQGANAQTGTEPLRPWSLPAVGESRGPLGPPWEGEGVDMWGGS